MARWEFALEIDRSHKVPFAQQIARALVGEIQRGRLRPGDRLPGSRTLAKALRVHRQTVVSAIDDLIAAEWLVSRPASGIFVANVPERPAPRFGAPPARRFSAPDDCVRAEPRLDSRCQ